MSGSRLALDQGADPSNGHAVTVPILGARKVAMTDKELRRDVTDALDADPGIEGGDIGVAVSHGIVTLSGHVGSYAEKVEVERAVCRVRGVRAIAMKVMIRPADACRISDDQIAARALAIIDWYARIPSGVLMVKVDNGWVTLTGQVERRHQAVAAEEAVQMLSGVSGISNLIVTRADDRKPAVREHVRSLLRRLAADQTEVGGPPTPRSR